MMAMIYRIGLEISRIAGSKKAEMRVKSVFLR
jgi:hypothetical protein